MLRASAAGAQHFARKVLGEINDHPPKKFGDRIRLIAIKMEGAFGNEGALPLFYRDVIACSPIP
jgi:hypothetical protein